MHLKMLRHALRAVQLLILHQLITLHTIITSSLMYPIKPVLSYIYTSFCSLDQYITSRECKHNNKQSFISQNQKDTLNCSHVLFG